MIEITEAPPSPWTEVMQNVYSQFGEDGIIEEIFKRIGTTNKQCFEVGAADGKWFSNSRKLIDSGWRAALIEAEPSNWPELDKLDGDNVVVVHGKVEASGENKLDSILPQCIFGHPQDLEYIEFDGQPDLGVIDVDGQEYYLWNTLMKFRPRVMVVEYDPAAPANFVPDLNGKGQASFAAICSVAISKGYFNVAATHTNGIFVLNSEREKFLAADKPPKAKLATDYCEHCDHEYDVTPQPPSPTSVGKFNREVLGIETPKAPVLATGKEQEIKIAAILSRPRFGLNVFWDCASEALAPWGIPIQSFYSPFWGQCLETAMEDNLELDWILTLDYDSLFTSTHMQMLIDCLGQNPNVDAVAALQCRRGRPLPLAVRADGQMPLNGGPVQVTTAHFGLTLLRTSAIRKMKKPWFWSQPAPNGGWGEGRLDDDIAFWGRWRDAGNSLFVHTNCRIGHVEEMASQFDAEGKVSHSYLSDWRKQNGHTVKTIE